MAFVLLGLGILLSVIGWFWFLAIAFDDSVLWGLGVFLFPILSWVYTIMNFSDVKKPFFLEMIGVVLMLSGMLMLAPEVPVAV